MYGAMALGVRMVYGVQALGVRVYVDTLTW